MAHEHRAQRYHLEKSSLVLWYHVTGAEEFEFGRRFFYRRDPHFGVKVLIQTRVWKFRTESVTPASISWRSQDDDS